MQHLQTLRAFLRHHQGSTAIEYSLIAALIAVFVIAAVGGVGTSMNELFYQEVNDGLSR